MCQLLGMNSANPADLRFSFTGFAARGGLTDHHGDGFGVGFFEDKATQKPENSLDNVGGMRVVTGAGIYVDGDDASEAANASYRWDEDIDAITPDIQRRSFLGESRPKWDANFVTSDGASNTTKIDDLKL